MKNKKLACVALAGVMAVSVLGGCGGSKSGGGRTNSDGAKVVTIWSPTDEPAIEEWWVEKSMHLTRSIREQSSLNGRPLCVRTPMLMRIRLMRQ